MSFISRSIKMAQKLNVLEISFFKFYLVSVTLLLAIWFPVLLSADISVYIVLFVLSMIYTFTVLIKQQWNFYAKMFKKWIWYHAFKKMSMFDISIFKLTMSIFALLLAKLFPVLLTIDIAWLTLIGWLFLWYYFHLLYSFNEK